MQLYRGMLLLISVLKKPERLKKKMISGFYLSKPGYFTVKCSNVRYNSTIFVVMLKAEWLTKLPYYFLYALVIFMPFSYNYASICIIFFTITSLFTINYQQFASNFRNNKIVWAFLLYIILYIFSFLYSDNTQTASADLQTKMSLIIFPLLLGCGLQMNKKIVDRFFLFFVTGVTLAALVNLLIAYRESVTDDTTIVFFYHNLVRHFDISAVYMSLYCFLSIGLLLTYNWEDQFTGKWKWLRVILVIVQISFFILLSARMLIALFVIFLIPYAFYYYVLPKLTKLQLSISAIMIIITLAVLLLTDNPIKSRYTNILDKDLSIVTLNDYSDVSLDSFSNLTLRLFIWKAGYEVINEHGLWWTGAGNGDVQDVMNEKMSIYNVNDTDGSSSPLKNVNMHNMLLQTLISVGLIGLFIILIIVIYPFFQWTFLLNNPWFLFFFVSTLFFLVQESILQTQSGTVYYALIYSLFINILYKKN